MAERLRRWTRNPLGSPRAGSNPADYARSFTALFSIANDKEDESTSRKKITNTFYQTNFNTCHVFFIASVDTFAQSTLPLRHSAHGLKHQRLKICLRFIL